MIIQYKLLSTDHELKINWWQVDFEINNKRKYRSLTSSEQKILLDYNKILNYQ